MSNKRTTLYLRGKLYWAKIFGNPRPNYDGDAREWTFEFEPDEDSVELLEEHDLDDRLKDKRDKKGYENRKKFIILKRSEFKVDGDKNDHIRVVDADNQAWNGALIGNETVADVKVTVVDYGPRKKKGIYPVAIRVLDHVAFERDEFEPLPEDDVRRKKAAARRSTIAEDFGDDDTEVEEKPARASRKRREPEKVNLVDDDLDDVPFD